MMFNESNISTIHHIVNQFMYKEFMKLQYFYIIIQYTTNNMLLNSMLLQYFMKTHHMVNSFMYKDIMKFYFLQYYKIQ